MFMNLKFLLFFFLIFYELESSVSYRIEKVDINSSVKTKEAEPYQYLRTYSELDEEYIKRHRIEKEFRTFYECATLIKAIALDHTSNKRVALEKFLVIQNKIFESFSGNLEIEEKLIKFLIDYLKNATRNVRVERISKGRPIRFG